MTTLTARQVSLLDLFKGAIAREQGAQAAYRKMLPMSDDPAITRVIERFAEQEQQHEVTLLEMYNALRTGNGAFSEGS